MQALYALRSSLKNLICPSCGKQALSIWQKLTLGPVISKNCTHCNERISVPFASMFAIIPFILAISLAPNMHLSSVIIFGLIGFVIMSVIHIKYVPLIHTKL